MALFWLFLVLVVVIVLGNALVLLRTARPSRGRRPPDSSLEDSQGK